MHINAKPSPSLSPSLSPLTPLPCSPRKTLLSPPSKQSLNPYPNKEGKEREERKEGKERKERKSWKEGKEGKEKGERKLGEERNEGKEGEVRGIRGLGEERELYWREIEREIGQGGANKGNRRALSNGEIVKKYVSSGVLGLGYRHKSESNKINQKSFEVSQEQKYSKNRISGSPKDNFWASSDYLSPNFSLTPRMKNFMTNKEIIRTPKLMKNGVVEREIRNKTEQTPEKHEQQDSFAERLELKIKKESNEKQNFLMDYCKSVRQKNKSEHNLWKKTSEDNRLSQKAKNQDEESNKQNLTPKGKKIRMFEESKSLLIFENNKSKQKSHSSLEISVRRMHKVFRNIKQIVLESKFPFSSSKHNINKNKSDKKMKKMKGNEDCEKNDEKKEQSASKSKEKDENKSKSTKVFVSDNFCKKRQRKITERSYKIRCESLENSHKNIERMHENIVNSPKYNAYSPKVPDKISNNRIFKMNEKMNDKEMKISAWDFGNSNAFYNKNMETLENYL